MNFAELNALAEKYKSQTLIKEREELYRAVLFSPPGWVVEVGHASGGTTVVLLGAAEKVSKKILCVDSHFESEHKKDFSRNILENPRWRDMVRQIQKPIKDCINEIPRNLSVVFIDGCHKYEQVKEMYDLFFPQVIQDGYIAVHDIDWKPKQKNENENVVSLFDDSSKFNWVKIVGTNMVIGKKK